MQPPAPTFKWCSSLSSPSSRRVVQSAAFILILSAALVPPPSPSRGGSVAKSRTREAFSPVKAVAAA